MKKNINKLIFIVIIILIIGFCLLVFIDRKNNNNQYETNLFYMDTYIYIKFKTDNKKLANEVLKEVDNIYKLYHQLTDKYNSYDDIINIYYINYNNTLDDTLTLNPKLYNLLKYGKNMYRLSGGKIDISMGNVLDIWHSYRDSKIGIPTISELESVNTTSIDDIILLDDYKIKNNHVNIDLGCIAKGYATKEVGEFLKEKGISEFLINAGGNVLVGKKANGRYKIGLEDPDSETGVFKVIETNNKAIVTSGGYERFYEYNGEKYHHIIDPDTLFPPNYMKSVTVISNDSALADFLSTNLFLMSIDDGLEYIKKYDGVDAIWYSNDNKIITTEGIGTYE